MKKKIIEWFLIPTQFKDVRANFNIDFFLKILPLKDHELAMSEM